MIVYDGTKLDFLKSVELDTIAYEIEENIYTKMNRHTVKNEFRAWENSLEYMYKVLNDNNIPEDAGIAIEYNIPQTSKRVDFLVSGFDEENKDNVVIIELKQWDKIHAIDGKDALVETYTENGIRQVVHPSYQAWSYAMMIKDYNQTVQAENIILSPCSYLHNYRRTQDDPLDKEQYRIYLEEAPAFTRGQVEQLRAFIKKCIVKGDHKHIGSVAEIEKWAKHEGASIYHQELLSQFRCNGSDGYLAWLDHILEIRENANCDLKDIDYDIRILDSPIAVKELIYERNVAKNRARILAGYCWNWIQAGKNNSNIHDIQIGDFTMSWNLGNTTTFAIDETSVNEVGCIHTSQGLEFDYVGVIIGEDMRYEHGRIVTDYTKRASTDQSLKGIKKLAKENPKRANEVADEIIKNTYRTLMTRGMKGCYVYCVDQNLANYLKECLK